MDIFTILKFLVVWTVAFYGGCALFCGVLYVIDLLISKKRGRRCG